MDAATGLIYVGAGQYYDPATGRSLTRGVYPGAPNPYVPWQGDPLGMLVGPLALLALIRGKRKAGKIDQILVALVVLMGVSLSCVSPGTVTPTPTPIPSSTPSPTGTEPVPSQGSQSPTPSSTPPATATPIPLPCPTPTVTQEYVGDFNLSGYYTTSETQKIWTGGKVIIPSDPTKLNIGKYLSKSGGYTNNEADAQTAKSDFLQSGSGVCMQGSGELENGKIIHCSRTEPVFEWGANLDFVRPFETVAKCQWSKLLKKGDTIMVDSPWLSAFLDRSGNPSGYLEVTDNGQASGLCDSAGHEGIDIYMGIGENAYTAWRDDFIVEDSKNEVLGNVWWPVYRVKR